MQQTTTTPHSKNAKQLLNDIDQGLICLPRFQRDFVWSIEKSAALVDSVLKGFPIGALIFWRTSETLKDHRQLGRFKLPEPPVGQERNYVLDGQQRLTSLYAALRGVQIELADGRKRDFSQLWVNLSADAEDDDFCVSDIADLDESRCIPLQDLFELSALSLAKDYPEDTHPQIEQHRDAIASYLIPYVQLQGAPISVATEVFTRVNIGGEKLSLFEIMVAKTFDAERDFDLLSEWEALQEELERRGYGTVDAINMLQLIGLLTVGDVRRKTILDIPKSEFINAWPDARKSIGHAVDFCRTIVGLRVSRLLPYTACLVPLAYFFHSVGGRKASANEQSQLTAYIFRAGWSNRYTGPVETNLNQDRHKIDMLINSAEAGIDFPAVRDREWLAAQEFRANEAFSKTILAILAREDPRSFDTHSKIDLDNSAMQRGNSRNFHHFFPKAFLRKKGVGPAGYDANSIMNITLVDDYLNKRSIRARAPSEYLNEFSNENNHFRKSMKSHLIDVSKTAAVWEDDYERFLLERADKVISKFQEIGLLEDD